MLPEHRIILLIILDILSKPVLQWYMLFGTAWENQTVLFSTGMLLLSDNNPLLSTKSQLSTT